MPRLSAPSRRDCSPDSALAARSRRGGVPSLHRCIAAVPAAALALLLFAALAAPAQAAVLVSNIGQTVSSSSSTLGTTQDLSQGFTTATTAGTLDSIEVKFAAVNDGSAHPTVTLHRGSPTSTAIATLTAPSGTITAHVVNYRYTAPNYTYTAPSNTTLTAATTYYVVLEGSDDDLAPQITTSDNEDSGGETGWSVANGYGFRTATSDGAFTTSSSGAALLIRVNGTAMPAPSKPRNLAAAGGDTQVTLTWTAPARAGATAITHYQYRYSAGSTVASTTEWTDVPDGSDAGTSAADERSVAVSGLLARTQYAFEVRAVNNRGESPVAGPVTTTLGLRSCSSAPDLAGMGRTAVWTATMTVGERAFTTSPAYSRLGSFTSGGSTYGSLSGNSVTVGRAATPSTVCSYGNRLAAGIENSLYNLTSCSRIWTGPTFSFTFATRRTP